MPIVVTTVPSVFAASSLLLQAPKRRRDTRRNKFFMRGRLHGTLINQNKKFEAPQ
jgi:hypothetical protein